MNLFKGTFIDRRLIRFILLIYFMAYAIDFASVVILRLFTDVYDEAPLNFLNLLFQYILTYSFKLCFLLGAVYITAQFINQKISTAVSSIIHITLAFLLSFYTAFVVLALNRYVFEIRTTIEMESIWVRGLNGLSFNFFIYIAIIAIVYAYYYLQKRNEVALRHEQLKTQLLDSKINALQSQLQPHFLFNVMNDISSLMDIDIEKAQNAIADLSDLLRRTLQIKNTKYVTLGQELDILQHYLNIEKIRYGDKINCSLNVDSQIYNLRVPPLLLQPFVENAIKHGFSYHHDSLHIILNIYVKDQRLFFEIQNDGAQLENNGNFIYGDGISNVLERLESLYGRSYYFRMKNIVVTQSEKGFVQIVIAIPQDMAQ